MMKASMIAATLAAVASFLSVLASVTSTPLAPVEPIFALEDLDPYEACLFTCNLCFTTVDSTDKLLDCSNKICSALLEGKCPIKEFIWLGSHCGGNYEVVESMWTGSRPKAQRKPFKLH